jgi:hypothetical protein
LIPTKLGHPMAGLIHDARNRVYPDAAHAFLFLEPEQVAADVNASLAKPSRASCADSSARGG